MFTDLHATTMGALPDNGASDECAPAPDPFSWPEYEFRAHEMALEAGQLEILENMLQEPVVGRILALGDPRHAVRIQANREKLASAKRREANVGVPGSLIDPNHHLTKLIATCDKMYPRRR